MEDKMATESFDREFKIKNKEAYIKLVAHLDKECSSPKPKINIQRKIDEGKKILTSYQSH